MKFKKSWIFWICYYGIAIIGNVLAAVLLRDKWNFNGWSAFPIGYIAFSIFLLWYFPSEHYLESCVKTAFIYARRYFKIDEYTFYEECKKTRDPARYHSQIRCLIYLTLLSISIFIPFVLFFSAEAKILSILIVSVVFLLGIFIWIFLFDPLRKERKLKQKSLEQELKEQQQREELGKWK